MNYIGKFIANFKDAYNEINGATLTGAIDAVVVRQEDGSFLSSPFHVRFGKIGVLRSREKVVDIEINGEPVDIHMKLGETGEAFFVEELGEDDEVSSFLGTSPLPSYLDFDPPKDDDLRSQDSGVEAEEVICKSLQIKGPGDAVQMTSSAFVESCGRRSGVSALGVYESTSESHGIPAQDGETRRGVSMFEMGDVYSSETTEEDQNPSERPSAYNETFKSSPSMDVPSPHSGWREEFGRSKSLSSEFPILKGPACIISDGQGSKTDVEETAKVNRTSRRRRKRRTNGKKHRTKATENLSSDNSTTSETADLSSLSVTGAVSATQDTIFHMEDVATEDHDELRSKSTLVKDVVKENWRPERVSVTLGPDFHPFSDTDISPPPSPGKSRSNTPVKSDTEYECEKQKKELSETTAQSSDDKWSWTWGELPTPPSAPPRSNASSRQGHADSSKLQGGDEIQNIAEAEDAQRSMLGNMFSFMRATKKARHNPESEGIYLEDLNLEELDPEVAALYFPKKSLLLGKENFPGFRSVAKDDDVESGNGTSLPQSPHSVEGAIGGAKLPSIDSDLEEPSRHPIFDYRGYHDLAFSLCGALHEHLEEPFPESLFLQSLVTYDDFCENPLVIDNPNLVVRLGGKYMNWNCAAPQIMSLVLFQRPLPSRVVENVEKENMPKKEIRKRTESKGYSWFSWGRQQQEVGGATQTKNKSLPNSTASTGAEETTSLTLSRQPMVSLSDSPRSDNTIATLATTTVATHEVSVSATYVTETHRETVVATVTNPRDSQVEQVRSEQLTKETRQRERQESSESDQDDKSSRRYRKTIRLSNDQIKKLNLRSGSNEVVFSVTTAYQGTTRCKCHIYLWNYDDKIVVSDIDGTITKSDVLGHILPIIGKDWAQGGVAQLFTKIKNNGYNFLYLSARAIGQARITREYLRSIKQGDVSLPDGPLLLNPTSLIQAFHREVIEKKPEEFKISCLRDIKALFPSNQNPFYAGYGNRINDVWAYSAVGIPIQRIFTINHKGELKHEMTQTFQTTYVDQIKMVDDTFPPIEAKMVPRSLLPFLYDQDSGDEEDTEGVVDIDYYDSDWEGVPTGVDAMSFGA